MLDCSKNTSTARWWYLATVWTIAIYLGVATFVQIGGPITDGIDGSFFYALNTVAKQGFSFGQDVAATYGPLGFLVVALDVGNNLFYAISFSALVSIVFTLLIVQVFSQVNSLTKLSGFMLLTVIASSCLTSISVDYRVLMIVMLSTCGFLLKPNNKNLWMLLAASAFSAIALFIKFNTGIICLLFLAGVTASQYIYFPKSITSFLENHLHNNNTTPKYSPTPTHLTESNIPATCYDSKKAILVLVPGIFFGVCVVIGYFNFHTLNNFTAFIQHSLQIAGGYSQAMSTTQVNYIAIIATFTFGLIYLCATCIVIFTRSPLALVLCLMIAPLFMSFKHAFIRMDHLWIFPCVMLSVVSLILLFCRQKQDYILAITLSASAILAWGCFVYSTNSSSIIFNRIRNSGIKGIDTILQVAQFQHLKDNLKLQTQTNMSNIALDSFWQKKMASCTHGVDCLPYNIVLCPANGLKWCPNPVMELFHTFTPALDNWTKTHFQAKERPDFLIVGFPDIDWRHPFFSSPITWRTILCNYKSVDIDSKRGYLLLQQRKISLEETLINKGKDTLYPGEWIKVPQDFPFVVAKINMIKTFTGTISELLFRTAPVFVDLCYADSSYGYFRAVPINLESGVLLSTLPRNLEGMKELFAMNPKQHVTYFRIYGPGLVNFKKKITIEWFKADYR